MKRVILGSQSPRRRELLSMLDIPFEAISIDADEHYPATLEGEAIPLYIARAKAEAYRDRLQAGELLITADTVVMLEGKVYGKPQDDNDARRMLHELSGRTHQVYTGVCLMAGGANGEHKVEELVDKTDVTFRQLSDEETDYYITHYRPLDKAGAYGIQEYIGLIGIESIRGSYFNVMGLPTERLYSAIKKYLQ